MKTLVIGASVKPDRYSYSAVDKLTQHDHEVIAIGSRQGKIGDIKIEVGQPDVADIDTVTLYINPKIQASYIDYIIGLKPRRIIFNPGTENLSFSSKAGKAGIKVLNACTLVMLSTGQY